MERPDRAPGWARERTRSDEPRRRRALRRPDDGGFTLLELLVAMVVAGIVMAGGVWALSDYSHAQAERGSANDMVGAMRDTAEQAQSEGRTYCVEFNSTTTWSVWRYSCSPSWSSGGLTATETQPVQQAPSGVQFGSFNFTTPSQTGLSSSCPAGAVTCVYFYPRGTASSGNFVVSRQGASKTYRITVEGLTSRVYLG